jgi:hypothetical protein
MKARGREELMTLGSYLTQILFNTDQESSVFLFFFLQAFSDTVAQKVGNSDEVLAVRAAVFSWRPN